MPAGAQGLPASDQKYLQEKLKLDPNVSIWKKLNATQNECIHLLITRPGPETKRLKDLESYLDRLADIFILHQNETNTPCPR
jgi:hypothetical protein